MRLSGQRETLPPGPGAPQRRERRDSGELREQALGNLLLSRVALGKNFPEDPTGALEVLHVDVGLGKIELRLHFIDLAIEPTPEHERAWILIVIIDGPAGREIGQHDVRLDACVAAETEV